MDNTYLSPAERRALAEQALQNLGADRHRHILVRVRCPRSHHVAIVYGTSEGPVYRTQVGPHAHGSRDFVDVGHHGRRPGTEYVDLLDAGAFAEDVLPARCECGNRSLSRAELRGTIDEHQRVIQVP